MKSVIIDCGLGNITSIKNMLRKSGAKEVEVSDSINEIKLADKLILTGVGSFDSGIEALFKKGLIEILEEKAFKDKVPFLGICLGMQLLLNKSEEGCREGLGWIEGESKKFTIVNEELKVPHMGWNEVEAKMQHPLNGQPSLPNRFYFVHSYYVNCKSKNVLMSTNYGEDFTSAIIKDNIVGVQFHPEKSHCFGVEFFKNFLEWIPEPC